jgi:hypothetical protein
MGTVRLSVVKEEIKEPAPNPAPANKTKPLIEGISASHPRRQLDASAGREAVFTGGLLALARSLLTPRRLVAATWTSIYDGFMTSA